MNRHLKHARLNTSMMALAIAATCMSAAGTTTAENPAGASAPLEPVKYRVKEKSLIGNDVHEAGATVSYAGLPSENLEPLCDEGRRRAAAYQASNEQRVKTMIAANSADSAVGDPAKFMEAFAKALADERAEHQAQQATQQAIMAQMLEMQQQAAIQLAQAAENMAKLAAVISAQPAAPAAPETPAAPVVADAVEVAGSDATAPAKRTRS